MIQQLPAPAPAPVAVTPAPAPVVNSDSDECRHLADVPLRVEAVLDRIVMNIRAVAQLRKGSLLVLSRSAGDSVQLHVGGVPIASGEVVVNENTVGVRITDLSPGA